jgi:hypothetical protein
MQRGKRRDTKADLARIRFLPGRRPEAGPLFLLMKPLVARRSAVGGRHMFLPLAAVEPLLSAVHACGGRLPGANKEIAKRRTQKKFHLF